MEKPNQFSVRGMFLATAITAAGCWMLVILDKPKVWLDEGDRIVGALIVIFAVATPLLASTALFGRPRFWFTSVLGSLAFVTFYLWGIPVE
jgi:hypothetical protein